MTTVVVASWALTACASAYGQFRPEAEIPSCAAWLREADGIPRRILRHRTGIAAGRPCDVAVESLGSGRASRVVVLIHGVLSDRRTWRFMKGRLAAAHDVLLVDLPGCGDSDRPAPEDLGPREYDPGTLATAVLDAVRAELRGRPAPDAITLVGHSYGSALILRALGDPDLRSHYADVLDLVDGAVLFSAPDCSYAKRDPTFEAVANVSALEVRIGNLFGMVRSAVADGILHGVDDPSVTPREEVDRVWEILSDPSRLAAAQSMLRHVVPFTDDLRPDWARVERQEAENRRIRVPILLVCGGRDDAVPSALSYKLQTQLFDARLRVVPRVGHGVPVERPEVCAALVLAFAGDRGAGWAAAEEIPAPVATTPAAWEPAFGRR